MRWISEVDRDDRPALLELAGRAVAEAVADRRFKGRQVVRLTFEGEELQRVELCDYRTTDPNHGGPMAGDVRRAWRRGEDGLEPDDDGRRGRED